MLRARSGGFCRERALENSGLAATTRRQHCSNQQGLLGKPEWASYIVPLSYAERGWGEINNLPPARRHQLALRDRLQFEAAHRLAQPTRDFR